MALRGNLQDFGTTQLLNLVHLARKTGSLQLTKKSNGAAQSDTSELFFREGKLIHAMMTGYDGLLTSMLVSSGKLPLEQAQVIKKRSQDLDDKRLALILIHNGYVSKEDVIQSATDYVQEIIYRLFTWQEGRFYFEPNKQPHASRITVPIDLANIIIEGSRRVEEAERLEDELPDLDIALKFTDHPNAKLQNISLSEREWKVISYVKPDNSIRKIARAARMNDFQIRRIVYGLLQAGIVELVRPPGMAVPGVRPSADGTRTYVKRGVVRKLISFFERR